MCGLIESGKSAARKRCPPDFGCRLFEVAGFEAYWQLRVCIIDVFCMQAICKPFKVEKGNHLSIGAVLTLNRKP